MKGTVHKYVPSLAAVLALTLVVAGLWIGLSRPTPAQAAKPQAPAGGIAALPVTHPQGQQADNSQCLGCHSAPNQVHKFPNGDTISVTVDQQMYQQSVHNNLACQVCHTNITGFPHPEVTAKSAREFTLQYKATCNQCHPGQAKEIAGSAHAKLAAAGNPNTPICADCHNPHTQKPIQKDANGDPAPSERPAIALICSKCHSAIVDEYKKSVHGAALFEKSNPDVPACNDCHGVHNISQARTVEFRLNSPQLCATCHTRGDIMDKYGISTKVLNTYVADFHGTTVTLFSKERSGVDTNKPVCYDCHGVHNIAAVNDPQRGLEIKQNMLAVCQKCHPDASQNFPASWMSHYIPSPTRSPLVYYVSLFYKIFIPLVLGGMALFVLSDILHRAGITGRKTETAGADVADRKSTKE